MNICCVGVLLHIGCYVMLSYECNYIIIIIFKCIIVIVVNH